MCRLDQIESEGGVTALVGGEAIAVFRTFDDQVFALSNYDPFGKASVLARGIVGTRRWPTRRSRSSRARSTSSRSICAADSASTTRRVTVATYEVRVVDGVGKWSRRAAAGGIRGVGGPSPGRIPVGVTAARRAEEQIALLERRGAEVIHAPALSVDPNRIDEVALLAATKDVLSAPVDVFLATTGIGMKSWLAASERWGLLDDLVAHLSKAEILARGPKSVGVLRRFGLRGCGRPSPRSSRTSSRTCAAATSTACGSWSRSTASRCPWPRTHCAGSARTSRP